MTAKQIVVIGNGRPAQECLSILDAHSGAQVRLVLLEPDTDLAQRRLRSFCAERGIDTLVTDGPINSPESLAHIVTKEPDFILSINNFKILKSSLLAVPREGAINFHNGPIPRYRGMNIPSWAIWNNEPSHGVSWHYMEPEIDAGDIAAAEEFPLAGDETALSLTLRCIDIGVSLFKTQLDNILGGQRYPAPDHGQTGYYARNQFPNDGFLDFDWPYSKIARLLRATDFRPFPNPFTFASIPIKASRLIINDLEIEEPNVGQRPGTIVRADSETLIIACRDQLLGVTRVMEAPDIETSIGERIRTLGLGPGQQLPTGESERSE